MFIINRKKSRRWTGEEKKIVVDRLKHTEAKRQVFYAHVVSHTSFRFFLRLKPFSCFYDPSFGVEIICAVEREYEVASKDEMQSNSQKKNR